MADIHQGPIHYTGPQDWRGPYMAKHPGEWLHHWTSNESAIGRGIELRRTNVLSHILATVWEIGEKRVEPIRQREGLKCRRGSQRKSDFG